MQVSKTWLQTFFNQSLDQIDIENILTMAGLEVDEVKSFDSLSDLVVVAEVVSVEKHPDAGPKAVSEALSAFKIPPSYVSNIKLKLKNTTGVSARGRRPAVAAAPSSGGEAVVAAASLIKACGGIDEARSALTLAEKVARTLE